MKKAVVAACSALALNSNAFALEIGALKVESHLGEPFKASVRINPSPSEKVDLSCVSLDQKQVDEGIFQLKHAKIDVIDSGRLITIATDQSINEPILDLKLDIHCGESGEIGKLFTVFLDPVSLSPPVVQQAEKLALHSEPVEKPQMTAHRATATKTITVRSGDTLSGIASRYFPDDRTARRRFIAEVLEENPGLSPNLIRSGSKLNIPDLKSTESPIAPEEQPKAAKPPEAKPAFHLDIVSGEQKANQALKQTETQLITRADDQAVQMLQLKSQIKSLEGKLAELQNRVAQTNRLLARINMAKPQQPRETIPNLVWIGLLAALMAIGGIVYFRWKKKERENLFEQYIDPASSRPALMDHLDYFESDAPERR